MSKGASDFTGRVAIINAVRTPLGYFTLVVLISEGILGGLAIRATGSDFTLLVGGMLLVLIMLVVTVAAMALKGKPGLTDAGAPEAQAEPGGPPRPTFPPEPQMGGRPPARGEP